MSCADRALSFVAIVALIWRRLQPSRQAADVRRVKGFFMAASCLASRDSPAKTTTSFYRLDLSRPPRLVEEQLLLAVQAQKISYTISASTGTPSHFAAAARS